MKHSLEDTIAAIATPIGVGGVGVIRISGDNAKCILLALLQLQATTKIRSHQMTTGWINNRTTGRKIDHVMVCFFKKPRSYTGEDVAEIYCHSGLPILDQTLKMALGAGARLAERGEFTKRAFLNGKIDLTQAEAILDIVTAKTNLSAGFSACQLAGRLTQVIKEQKDNIIKLQAILEAQIDFAEVAPHWDKNLFVRSIRKQLKQLAALIATAEAGKIYREGLSTVIIGKPNVGKSSLLNALLGEDRAIVTHLPGTTRDSIEETITLKGIPFKIIDTAGIRHPRDIAEEFGVRRTERELAEADLAIIVVDASRRMGNADKMILKMGQGKPAVIALNKIDLGGKVKARELGKLPKFNISALKGTGLSQLKQGLIHCIQTRIRSPKNNTLLINNRHKECLNRAHVCLSRTLIGITRGEEIELLTIDLKEAIMALGEVTGEQVSEEVINMIFERFCVGK